MEALPGYKTLFEVIKAGGGTRCVYLFIHLSIHLFPHLSAFTYACMICVCVPGGLCRKVIVGDRVTVHATGTVKETGKKFWSTKDPGQKAFTYNAGVAQVITGWDQVHVCGFEWGLGGWEGGWVFVCFCVVCVSVPVCACVWLP